MRTAITILLIAAAFVGGYALSHWRSAAAVPAGRKVLYWVDPMHPAYKSDKPGIAPDCGMKLEPVYADGGQPAAAERRIVSYRDPLVPGYTSDKPGLNPETGNELVPVYAGDTTGMAPGTVQINADKQQLIGVQFGQVQVTPGNASLRANGKVTADETRITHVHTRVDGWVDQVFADFTGKFVQKGQRLLTLYSPEMYATQEEYLLSLKGRDVMKSSTLPAALQQSDSLIEATKKRLQLWDFTDPQIRQLERTQQPIRNFDLDSPATGFVTVRNVFPKQRITADMDLYTIVDLSHLWIVADVFESDAPNIRLGQQAIITVPYYPGRTYTGRVNNVLPQVDPTTRTIKVRLDVANPGLLLKPDMFVDVNFKIASANRLTVPAEAVLDAGTRKTVFVDHSGGVLEPRQVETGERMGDRVEIRSGLRAGERIVTSGNFLIDSESQMRAASQGGGK